MPQDRPTYTAEQISALAEVIGQELDADILLYNGSIERSYDDKLIELCRKRSRRTNLILILITEGGDPDAAYRMSRCMQLAYKKFICMVSGYCKSAGTLLALGVNELVFSDHGEMGPLDVQMAKKDELWESESGLTVMTALTTLHEKARLSFEHFFMQTKIKTGGRITLRTATEIAAKLTTGLFSPLYQQLDPMHVGEAGRSMSIAKEYGRRLIGKSQNFTMDSLEFLISGYPSHGFVIDRIEARMLFAKVRKVSESEGKLLEALGDKARNPQSNDEPSVEFLTKEKLPEIKVLNNAETKPDAPVATERRSEQNASNPGATDQVVGIEGTIPPQPAIAETAAAAGTGAVQATEDGRTTLGTNGVAG